MSAGPPCSHQASATSPTETPEVSADWEHLQCIGGRRKREREREERGDSVYA